MHNVECLEKGEGKLLVMRSPKSLKDATKYLKYLPCPYYFGFVAKRELFKHCKVCPFLPEEFLVSVRAGKLVCGEETDAEKQRREENEVQNPLGRDLKGERTKDSASGYPHLGARKHAMPRSLKQAPGPPLS